MAEALATAMGHEPTDLCWPLVTGDHRLGDVRHVFASTTLASEVYGWIAQIDLTAGIRELATTSLRTAPLAAPCSATHTA